MQSYQFLRVAFKSWRNRSAIRKKTRLGWKRIREWRGKVWERKKKRKKAGRGEGEKKNVEKDETGYEMVGSVANRSAVSDCEKLTQSACQGVSLKRSRRYGKTRTEGILLLYTCLCSALFAYANIMRACVPAWHGHRALRSVCWVLMPRSWSIFTWPRRMTINYSD